MFGGGIVTELIRAQLPCIKAFPANRLGTSFSNASLEYLIKLDLLIKVLIVIPLKYLALYMTWPRHEDAPAVVIFFRSIIIGYLY